MSTVIQVSYIIKRSRTLVYAGYHPECLDMALDFIREMAPKCHYITMDTAAEMSAPFVKRYRIKRKGKKWTILDALPIK